MTPFLEAVIKKNLLKLYPAASGEQHFMDKHKIQDTNKKMLEPDDGDFEVTDKVKVFNRKKNHFGNDMDDSIKTYDERVTLNDRLLNAHKKKNNRSFFDKEGHWIGSDNNSKNNKEAIKGFIGKAIGKLSKSKIAIVKEAKMKFKVGDNVHMGFGTKGGAGFRGKVIEIDDHGMVKIQRPKSELDKWYPKEYKGHWSKCTKEHFVLNESLFLNEEFNDTHKKAIRFHVGKYHVKDTDEDVEKDMRKTLKQDLPEDFKQKCIKHAQNCHHDNQKLFYGMQAGFFRECMNLDEKHIGFKALEKKVEGEGKSKKSADAIAAAVGRKKYGKKKFAAMAKENVNTVTDYINKFNESNDPKLKYKSKQQLKEIAIVSWFKNKRNENISQETTAKQKLVSLLDRFDKKKKVSKDKVKPNKDSK